MHTVVVYTTLIAWTLVVGIPIYWLIITAIKHPQDISAGASFIPWVDFQPRLNSFASVFGGRGESNRWPLINSALVALSTAAISTVIGSAGGYALARFSFRIGPWGNDAIAFGFLIQRMFPPAILLIPFLLLYRTLNLLDTLPGLILAYCAFNIPFVVWIMRDFFRSLPVDIEESAMIDGCSHFGVLWRIAIPLSAPGFVTAFVLVMIASWNEFLFALTFTFIKAVTLPLILAGSGYGSLAALTLVSALPVVIMGLALERYIARGLTFGAVK